MTKRAIILAGGKGRRLLPYTVVLPKPLMPIGDYPILEILVKQLVKKGFEHLTMSVNHQAEIIKAFFGDGSKWGVKIDYSLEDKPLSTMAPLKLIKDLPENFLVMNGDILTDLDYLNFLNVHVNDNNLFTVSVFKKCSQSEYGVLEIDNNKKIFNFQEKPMLKHNVSMGIYALNKKVLDYIPENQLFGFDHLMYSLIEKNILPTAKIHKGYWLDIGNPSDYKLAIDEFEHNKDKYLR